MTGATAALEAVAAVWLRAMGRACWEGALAFLAAFLFCACLPGVTGNLRCWVWRLAFVKLLVALWLWQPIELPLLRPQPVAAGTRAASPLRRSGLPAFGAPHAPELPTPALGNPAGAQATPLRAAARPRGSGGATGWLLAWLLGLGLCGGRMAAQWRNTRRWRRGCSPAHEPRLLAMRDELCRHLGLRRPPALLVHASYGPLLLGGARPAILLPASLVETARDAELQLVLAHELAHLKRRDFLWSSVVAAAHALFFFHPLVWLGRQQYRLAQEMACDELTVGTTGASTREYAELLLKVATAHRVKTWSSAALGVLGSGIALERRLIVLQQFGRRSKSQTVRAGMIAAAVALAGLAPWRVVAQTTSSEPGKPAPLAGPESRADASGSAGVDAGTAWEDMLLLQATRYLRLSSAQLQQLLPMARTANRQITELQNREDKVVESLRRIAVRQRDALVAGRQGSAEEQAEAITMRERAQRSRVETEATIVNGSLAGLCRVLTPKQVERAFLLQQGATPEGEAREPALLDPVAGFVNGGFGMGFSEGPGPVAGFSVAGPGPGKPGARGNQPSAAQQLLQAQMELSMLQRQLTEPFPPGGPAVGGTVFFAREEGDGASPKVFRFSTNPDLPPPPLPPGAGQPEVLDAAAFRQHLTDRAQTLSKQVADLRRQLFSADGGVSPEQYETLLRPLARRLFLSPRFQQAIENRLRVKN